MSKRIVILWMLLLVTIASVAGFYLAPSRKEIALMKLEDNNFEEALNYYTSLLSQGDHSINILSPLIKLYIHYGDIDRAILLLESFVKIHPDSIEGHKQLAALYKSTQRLHHYTRSLETLKDLAPSTATLRELADTYNFLGEYKAEIPVLARLINSKNYIAREEDYIKLASFYRINHQLADAVKTIMNAIDTMKYKVDVDTMQLAVQLLLENGEDQTALSVATHYLKEYGKENEAAVLSAVFQRQDKFDIAYEIIHPFLSQIDNSLPLLQQLVNLELARKKEEEVYTILSERFVQNSLPDSLAVALIDLSIRFQDYRLVETTLRRANLERMAEDELLRYADLSVQLNRKDLANIIHERLSEEYLQESPLLSEVLDVARFGTSDTVETLLALPREYIVTPEHKMIVAGIFLRHGHISEATTLFEKVPVMDMVEALDPVRFADLYLVANNVEKGEQLLLAAKENAIPAMQLKIDNILMLLSIGSHDKTFLAEWMEKHPDNKEVLADAYDLSRRYHQTEQALMIATHLYNRDSNRSNQLQLADALLLDKQYSNALNLLEPTIEKDKFARSMYLDGMAEWIRQAGNNTEQLSDTLLSSLLERTDLALDEKRNLAYLLDEKGFKTSAETIFLELASNQPFKSSDVSELLAFWGEKPKPEAVKWIEEQARKSYGSEQVLWLAHLNAIDNPESVIALLSKSGNITWSSLVSDEYINALIATNNKETLDRVLDKEITREVGIKRLVRLANVAEQHNLRKHNEQAWQKVYNIDPTNGDATKRLALLAFYQNRYSDAEQLITQYFEHNKADYQIHYAYAEILYRKKYKEEAIAHFVEAYQKLSALANKDLGQDMLEAHLLYRIGHTPEAIALYNDLLEKHPTNKSLRANFVQLLIENKQFKEAASLLAN